ncbi:MAG: hypothetical protein Q9168_005000 [Polycauliona sp. 1 TL-2023]
MEALSVAAAVVGILSVTAKLATGLTELVQKGKNLDKFITSFRGRQSLSRMDRLRWLKKESRIERMLLRLRASKSSLNLILVILTWYALTFAVTSLSDILYSVSTHEAITAIDTLIPTVEGIRTSSQDVSRRLAALEQSIHHLPEPNEMNTISYQNDESRAIDPHYQAQSGHETSLRNQDDVTSPIALEKTQPPFQDLELLLQCSRPYSRLQMGFQKLSLSSASIHTGNDTVMTGISLSAVSNLSLVSLPITIHEIWNKSYYTAAEEPRYLSSGQALSPAENELKNPSSSSTANQDDDKSDTASSETVVDHELDSHRSLDSIVDLPVDQTLGKSKLKRKVIIHGMPDTRSVSG